MTMSAAKKINPRLKTHYNSVVVGDLTKKFGYANKMEVPRLDKIVINMSPGRDAVNDSKVVKVVAEQLALITGQKPVVTKARKAIATYKLRVGLGIGCKVTLRSERMYEFLDRLVNVAMPRIRDFRGISGKSFDGKGNYAMGLKEQIVFPEIDFDKIDKIRGMDIIICTTAKTDDEARELLRGFNMPFTN